MSTVYWLFAYNGADCISELSCAAPEDQTNGHRSDCSKPFLYDNECHFECDPGYQLASDGIYLITCIARVVDTTVSIEWDNVPTACNGKLFHLL